MWLENMDTCCADQELQQKERMNWEVKLPLRYMYVSSKFVVTSDKIYRFKANVRREYMHKVLG